MRILREILFLVMITLLLWGTGCSPEKATTISKSMSAEEVIRNLEKRNSGIVALRGSGEISIDTPELSNSGNISVKVLKPDSLLVEITGPFGVGVAKGIVTSSEFTFYNSLENKVFLGLTNTKNLKTILRISIEFKDIINLFCGSMNFSQRPEGVTPTGSWKGEEYAIVYKTKSETVEYIIDAEMECVIRYTKMSSSGELIEEIKFKDFKKKSGFYVPFSITINRPQMDQSLALFYESVTVNDLPMDFTLKIPDSAYKVYL